MTYLYTKMKIFHFKDKLDSLSDSVDTILSPIHIRIKPTNICNHRCRYCAYRTSHLQLGKDMKVNDFIPKEKMFEIIEDLDNLGVKAVTFSGGGEPFCYPYLTDALKKMMQTNIQFAAITNGSKLEGELSEIFAHNGTWIRVSIDGWDNDSYAYYRNVSKEGFTKLLANFENFKKLNGKCYLGVNIIVDRFNAEHIYYLIEKLKNIGVNSVKIGPCIVSNEGFENNQYHQPIFEKIKSQIQQAREKLKDNHFEIYDTYHEIEEKFEKDYTWCPYLQILPVIGADLNVYSCQDKAYNIVDGLIGSIAYQSFKTFWANDKAKFFKINPSLHCNHHCIANEKNNLILQYLNADKNHLGFV